MIRSPEGSRALLALALLVALAQAARADEDVRKLEQRFRELAKEATPKTVCVKSYIEAKGDKAGFGSGAIVSADGYVLTCAHVIDIAKRCEVVLHDGTVLKAKVLGRNKRQDYALLKVESTKELPFYKTGDSTKVAVGDWVVALGHPGGPYADAKPAFAAGRVTGLHRRLPVQFFDRFYDDAIQTDVPIFAGNSGGPLVSLSGELIGLNGAILILNENAYAVPIQEVMRDYAALQKGEQIQGKQATQQDLAELQKQIGPQEMQKLVERALKNFGKLFGGEGGEDSPLAKLFEQFGKMFGGGGGGPGKGDDDDDGAPGREPGANPDFKKVLEQLQKMFGQGGGGEGNGEMPDFSKIFEKFFGGGGDGEKGEGEAPDLKKLIEGFQKMFGQGGGGDQDDDDDGDESPAPRKKPAPRGEARPAPAAPGGYVGLRIAKDETRTKKLGGAIVEEVLDGAPAAKAGLKKDDVIVAVDGAATPDADALRQEIQKKGPGARCVFTIDRARRLDATVVIERKDVTVEIADRPEGR